MTNGGQSSRRREVSRLRGALYESSESALPYVLGGIAFISIGLPLILLAIQGAGVFAGPDAAKLVGAGTVQCVKASVRRSLIVATLAAGMGLPAAILLSRKGRTTRFVILLCLSLPLLSHPATRAFVLRGVLGRNGPIVDASRSLGAGEGTLDWLLYSDFAVVLSALMSSLSLAIFVVLLGISLLRPEYFLVAKEHRARTLWRVWNVTIPLLLPSVIAAFLLVTAGNLFARVEVDFLHNTSCSATSAIQTFLDGGRYDLAAALAISLTVLVTGMVVVALWLLQLRRQRQVLP
jgi:ABC-type spermidine/putrescine transport system permease subunit I